MQDQPAKNRGQWVNGVLATSVDPVELWPWRHPQIDPFPATCTRRPGVFGLEDLGTF